MSRLTAELVASLIDRVTGPARNIGRSMDQLQRKQRQSASVAAQANRMTAASVAGVSRASSFALAGAARALAPVGGAMAAGSVITQAADFESALTNIQKKAGISAAETAKLGDEIKALATSGELAVPIEEIAAAYERGAAAGIPLAELREFSSLSAKAADAFEMSATDVGNAAAGFKTVLKIPMNEMERYFDLINGLADSGIADESGIVNYIDQAGAMAKTFGLSAEQTAAFGATLANLKIEASKGATATNSIFARLLAPQSLSDAGRAAYDALIKDDKKFQKQLAEGKADEAFLSMVDALEDLDASTRTGLLVDLFGREHMDTMLQLVEGSKELRRNLGYAGGTDWFGSLGKSYQLKLDDFWSQWQLMKNSLSELAIDLGTMSMPGLKAGLATARDLVGEISAGMDRFEASLDVEGLAEAQTAIGNLMGEVGRLMGLSGEGSQIERFFDRLAKSVNTVSAGIGAARDVMQALGLAEADGDTPQDRADRRSKLVDGFAEFNPVLGPTVKKVYDNFGNETMTPEKKAALERMQPAEQYDPGSGLSYREWLQQKRARDEKKPAPGEMRLPDLAYPTEVPRGARINAPLPTRRPAAEAVERMGVPAPAPAPRQGAAALPLAPSVDAAAIRDIDQQLGALLEKKRQVEEGFAIAPDSSAAATMRLIGDEMQRLMDRRQELEAALSSPSAAVAPSIQQPLAEEGARAHSTALQIGSQIQTALSVTAAPKVDDSSIRAASGSVRALIADLQRIPGLARQASDAAASARADYSGLHADLSRAG